MFNTLLLYQDFNILKILNQVRISGKFRLNGKLRLKNTKTKRINPVMSKASKYTNVKTVQVAR